MVGEHMTGWGLGCHGSNLLFSDNLQYREHSRLDPSNGRKANRHVVTRLLSLLPVTHLQLCEGILAPESWGAHDDPLDQASEDLEAEEFEHAYYRWVGWGRGVVPGKEGRGGCEAGWGWY
jgi:hypothetical protein